MHEVRHEYTIKIFIYTANRIVHNGIFVSNSIYRFSPQRKMDKWSSNIIFTTISPVNTI